jgi:hypothetical protein
MAFTAIPIGSIFGILGVYNSFGDYQETGIYPIADWAKFCDGSVINDPDSPLDGTYVPDLTNSVPVGAVTAGTIIPARTVGSGIYAFGEWRTQEVIANNESIMTIKYFQRIK